MIIKVCGMREPENIQQLAELQVDYMGFIFYHASKRYAVDIKKETLDQLPMVIKKTGVFVNESMDEIADKVIHYQLDAIQLHGHESAEFCRSLRIFLHNMQTEKKVEIIKAFGISEDFDFSELSNYEDFVDYFLFDTKTAEHGGSGLTFDWSVLDNYHGKKSYFLSGGLSAENLHSVKAIKDGRLYGVDLNSKFEVAPGLKNIEKLRSAFQIIRN